MHVFVDSCTTDFKSDQGERERFQRVLFRGIHPVHVYMFVFGSHFDSTWIEVENWRSPSPASLVFFTWKLDFCSFLIRFISSTSHHHTGLQLSKVRSRVGSFFQWQQPHYYCCASNISSCEYITTADTVFDFTYVGIAQTNLRSFINVSSFNSMNYAYIVVKVRRERRLKVTAVIFFIILKTKSETSGGCASSSFT